MKLFMSGSNLEVIGIINNEKDASLYSSNFDFCQYIKTKKYEKNYSISVSIVADNECKWPVES